MANLTEISISARKLFIYALLAFISLLMLRFLFFLILNAIPKPVPKIPTPESRFGKITIPGNVDIKQSTSGMKFSLENIQGKPPEATTVGKVYYMPKKSLSLLSAEKAENLAVRLKFSSEPQITDNTTYLYKDTQGLEKTLVVDIVTLNFDYRVDYTPLAADIFQKASLDTKEAMLSKVTSYVSRNSFFDASYLKSEPFVEIIRYDDPTKRFVSIDKIKNAHAIRVSYYRDKIDGLPVISPEYPQSYNYVLYTQSPPYDFLEISSLFWPVDFSNYSTYPLKTSMQAWQDLIDGYGYVIRLGDNTAEKIIIRKMYLAYYDTKTPQKYLQPVFLFEGDNGFYAYVPALAAEWLQDAEN